MTKLFSSFFLIISVLVITGCKKDAASKAQDTYYVKYQITSSSMPYYGVQMNTTYNNNKGVAAQTIINTGSWETTIGPVNKGFVTSLKAVKKGWSGEPEYYLKMALSISVSMNNGPFALKKSNDSTTARASAETSYIIE